jgi:hypothetical protein
VFKSAVFKSAVFKSAVFKSAVFKSAVFKSAVFISAVFISAVFISAVLPSVSVAEPSRVNALRKEGIAHYNGSRYNKAQETFTSLVQYNSTFAKDYLKLAHAAFSNQSFEVATVAYKIYFELLKEKKQRPKKETLELYTEAQKKVTKRRGIQLRKRYRSEIERVLHLIKKEALIGANGAIRSLTHLHKTGVIEPRFKLAHKKIKGALIDRYRALLSTWWTPQERVAPQLFKTLLEGVDEWREQGWSDPQLSGQLSKVLRGLIALYDAPDQALKHLSSSKRAEPQIRYAQTIALIKLKRYEEAHFLASALAQKVTGKDRLQLLTLAATAGTLAATAGAQLNPRRSAVSLAEMLITPPLNLEEAAKAPLRPISPRQGSPSKLKSDSPTRITKEPKP